LSDQKYHTNHQVFVIFQYISENIKQPYRSFKNFDVNAYVNDLDKICLLNESCDNVTDIDIEYDHFECEVSKVIDKHVPVKQWQSLTPVLKFSDLKQDLLLLVSITSTNDGLQSFLKQEKSNLQQTNAKK
jgi:hypothetical protein